MGHDIRSTIAEHVAPIFVFQSFNPFNGYKIPLSGITCILYILSLITSPYILNTSLYSLILLARTKNALLGEKIRQSKKLYGPLFWGSAIFVSFVCYSFVGGMLASLLGNQERQSKTIYIQPFWGEQVFVRFFVRGKQKDVLGGVTIGDTYVKTGPT